MNDNLWINLKVLSQLPAFAKLNTFHELFYIEREKENKKTMRTHGFKLREMILIM